VSGRELLLLVAQLRFKDGMDNQKIAAELVKSRILKQSSRTALKVGELVDEAGQWLLEKQARLAAIEIEKGIESKLAGDLVRKFQGKMFVGLIDAVVVEGGEEKSPAEYEALLKRYGAAAANQFDRLAGIEQYDDEPLHVSVGGGQTILDMVSALPDRKRTNVYYYAAGLIGRGNTKLSSHVGPEANATVAWARSGRLPKHLYYGTISPYEFDEAALAGMNRKERHEYAKQTIKKQIGEFTDQISTGDALQTMTKDINMAIADLGIVHPSERDAFYGMRHVEKLWVTGLLRPLGIDSELLQQEGAIGEISYNFFDKRGEGNPRWSFFLTAGAGSDHEGVTFYRNLVKAHRYVMVIAGAGKEVAVRAAIEAKLFNALVTDVATAKKLLA
jgi:DNA-binding transcriptional regulator LsrR (DeoR family)